MHCVVFVNVLRAAFPNVIQNVCIYLAGSSKSRLFGPASVSIAISSDSLFFVLENFFIHCKKNLVASRFLSCRKTFFVVTSMHVAASFGFRIVRAYFHYNVIGNVLMVMC